MASAVSVSRLLAKSFDNPDEVRTPDKTRVDVVNLDGYTIGRFTFQPGWRWSECIQPVVQTELCQLSHVGVVLSGRISTRMEDGTEKTIGAGEAYSIPPGHDAWVDGDDPLVAIEIMSADVYAKA